MGRAAQAFTLVRDVLERTCELSFDQRICPMQEEEGYNQRRTNQWDYEERYSWPVVEEDCLDDDIKRG